jgi:hypothetical protein
MFDRYPMRRGNPFERVFSFTVVAAVGSPIIRCVYVKSEKWSTKIVAPVYRLTVGMPRCVGPGPA